MSIEKRLDVLEKQMKRIQILQNENALLKKRMKELERSLFEKKDIYKDQIEKLEAKDEEFRKDIDIIKKEPFERIDKINEQDKNIEILELKMKNVELHSSSKIRLLETKVTDFRSRYIPILENFIAHKTLRNKRRK